MTAEEHNKTLATLYFIYGAMHGLTLLGLLLLIVVVKLATPDADLFSTFWVILGAAMFLILLFAVGLLPLIVGFGFLKRIRWVKPLAVVVAIISLVNIPIGTALGIYTLKFFKSEGGVKLYGGKSAVTVDEDLHAALQGAQPLMNWARKAGEKT
jgi:hypothetical protein